MDESPGNFTLLVVNQTLNSKLLVTALSILKSIPVLLHKKKRLSERRL